MDLEAQPSLRRKRKGPFRGPSRALKYKKLLLVQPRKVKVEIPSYLGAAVGEHALQFIGECSDWVKEVCPLNVVKWSDMPDDVIDRLYGKIKEVEAEKESSVEAENGAESEANTSASATSAAATQTQPDKDPIYLKLWKKTKQFLS